MIYLTTHNNQQVLYSIQNGIIVSGERKELKINHSGLFEVMPSISELCYKKSEIQEEHPLCTQSLSKTMALPHLFFLHCSLRFYTNAPVPVVCLRVMHKENEKQFCSNFGPLFHLLERPEIKYVIIADAVVKHLTILLPLVLDAFSPCLRYQNRKHCRVSKVIVWIWWLSVMHWHLIAARMWLENVCAIFRTWLELYITGPYIQVN